MMRGGRAPDTSLYKPRPISAPKARTPASTGGNITSSIASSTTSSTTNATTAGRSNATATAPSRAVSVTTTSRTAAPTASTRTAPASTAARSTASTASGRATAKPAVPTSRLPVATVTSSRLARTTPSTGVPTKPGTRSSSSTSGATRLTSSATSAISRSRTPTSSSASSKRLQRQHAADNQDDRDDIDSGYPGCMEIESLGDYAASPTESTYSILSGAGELNIITAVRLRPMSTAEKQKGYRRVVDMAASEGNWVRIVNPIALAPSTKPSTSSSLRLSSQRALSAASESAQSSFPPQFTQEFHFDHTFWSFDRAETRQVASQSSIYDELGLFTIENALQGYNCSIFAYGQTSAGKTYTMMGSESSLSSGALITPQSMDKGGPDTRRGLIPRICRGLFDRLTHESSSSSSSSSSDFSIHVSYIEIYHEHAYDLLAQASSANSSLTGKESLKVRESPETGVYVEHANQVRVTSFDDIKVLIDEGNRVRSVAATNANLRSSRSHAILTLYLKQTKVSSASSSSGADGASSSCESKKSKICLVDLAGSERADISGANGTRLREAGSINRSLATLADVISALSKRAAVPTQLHPHHLSHHQNQPPQEHFVPYRNSILTRLLKESLGGNAKTIMLAAISPCCAHYEESLSTLKYIERAKSVVNVARVNAESSLDVVDALRREILELKAQLQSSAALSTSLVSSSPSFCAAPTMVNNTLALQLDREEEDLDATLDPTSANDNSEGGALALGKTAAAESPLYAASLCFDEKEKSRLEREVAKLKVQMRKKERESQQHEFTAKALSDKVSAQVLRQQAHVINLVGIRIKYIGLAKLRALDRWRYSVLSIRIQATVDSNPAVMLIPGVDKNMMTNSENNNCDPAESRTVIKQYVGGESPVTDQEEAEAKEEEEDPACSVDEEEDDDRLVSPSNTELTKKSPSSSINEKGNEVSLFALLESKQRAFMGVGGGGGQQQQQQFHQVDVICSSIVTDFFGDTSSPLLHKMPAATSLASSKNIKSSNKSIKSDSNQLEQLPSDDDEHERIRNTELLIDEIIGHEAESNQALDSEYQQTTNNNIGSATLKKLGVSGLSDPSGEEDPSEVNQNDDDFDGDEEDFDEAEEEGDGEGDDEEDCDDAASDSPRAASSKLLSLASQRQRVQSKLARCLDAIDIARKAMGPTVRKLKQITDKSSLLLLLGDGDCVQIGTGMERQLLTQIDRSLVAVNQHVTDLGDMVVSSASPCLSVSLYTRFEGLLSGFCLQTMGLVCDQLTLGAGGTSAIARDQMDKQLDGFQVEVKELVNMALFSGSDLGNAALLVSALVELFGLSERMKFAWYAIDQKNLQRLALSRTQQQQQQILTTVAPKSSVKATTEPHTKASELLAQYDVLLARFEAQTTEFARREEEDRLALLLNTNRLEEEHEERVAELESELETAHASIVELEDRLLAHMSKVELLEQELELTAVVRTTNELLLKHHSSSADHTEDSGHHSALTLSGSMTSGSSPPSSSTQCSNIIVKLEEELASALIQINELETNQGAVASISDSQAHHPSPNAAEGRSSTETPSLHDACSTLADREMIEYMERTSEIEKQNNEAISKLNAVMIERRHSHLGINMPITTGTMMDHQVKGEGGARGNEHESVATASQVERVKQELQSALARAEDLEDQHLKLMVSFENQTDTVLHLEEELYDAQVHGKQAEDAIAGLHERVDTLETELDAAQELTRSLKDDLKDVMSELCVTEVKCGQLGAKCSELIASCEASKLRIVSLEEELQATKAENETLVSKQLVFAAEERCKALEAEKELLETRYNERESANALSAMKHEELLSTKAAALADLQNGLAQMTSDKLDLEEQYRALAEQQEREASRLCSLQKQLATGRARVQELEESLRRSEDASRDHEPLAGEIEAAQLVNATLTEQIAQLQSELCSVQTQMPDLEAQSAPERAEAASSQALLIQQVNGLVGKQHDVNEAQLQRMASDLEPVSERFASLETQNSDLQSLYDDLKMNHEVAEVRCAELEASVKALEGSNESAESQLTELQQRMVEVDAQKAELAQQLSDLASANVELESQVGKARAENAELHEKNAELEARQGELQGKFGRASRDQETLREELNAAQRTSTALIEEVAELKSELCIAQTQVSELEAKSAEEQSEAAESQGLLIQNKLAASAQQVESSKVEYQQCGDEDQVGSGASDLEAQYADLQSEYDDLKTSHEATETRCVELESSVKELVETNQGLESQVSDLQQQLIAEKVQKAELEQRIDGLASLNADLQSQIVNARATNVELHEENVNVNAQTLELQRQYDRASRGHESLREELEAARRSNASLTEELAELKSELDCVKAQVSESEAAPMTELIASAASQALLVQQLEAELAASTQQVGDLVAQLHDNEVQMQRMASDLEAAIEGSMSLETQNSDLQRAFEEIELSHEATEAHCAELESGVKVLEESTNGVEAQFTALQQQMVEENAQKAELEQQLQELASENSELQRQLTKAGALEAELQVKHAELKAQQLELQEKCRFLRELTATQKTKVTALTQELRVAYEQYDELALTEHEVIVEQSTKVSDLENQIQALSSQLQAIEADKVALREANASLLNQIQELEHDCGLKTSAIQALEIEHASLKPQLATSEGSESESASAMESTMELMQAERDATKCHLEQLQAEHQQGLTHSSEQALSDLRAELTVALSHAECLETQVVTFDTQLQAEEERLRLSQDEHVALATAREAELVVHRAQLVQLAQEEREAALAGNRELEAKIAALGTERTSLFLTTQSMEKELANAQLHTRMSEETLDSQTLLLAQAEDSLAVAVARANALENQLQEVNSLHREQLEALREELLADSEAQLTVLRHELEQTGADETEANAARILELERQLSEKCVELDRVADEYELQVSMASQHHGQELQEALSLAEHWKEQHQSQTLELRALQSDFEAKLELLNSEIANHAATSQNLQVYLERAQSSHSAELKQWEAKYNNSMAQLRQEMEQLQAVARNWELKCQDLEACVSPDAVRKVRAQIEAAEAHADEYEATYRVELENKLQLEFDLASVRKELHVAKQQLTELQCRGLELDAKDPASAALRSQARQNELAELERERQDLLEKSAQVAKREASVKLLEASAHARLEDLKQQHQNQIQQQKDVQAQLEASLKKAEQTQALLRVSELEAQVTVLAQRLAESNCRSEMQREELHSFRLWSALQELLRDPTSTTENCAIDYDLEGDENDNRIGGSSSSKKKLSPEARRLVLKHLNSLDTWFERAILGKTSSDAGRSERRLSLLAVLEGSEQGFATDTVETNWKMADRYQREDNNGGSGSDDGNSDDDGLIDASDADAVPVELDGLGDELLAMCNDTDGTDNNQQEEDTVDEPDEDDLDAIFDRDAALKYAARQPDAAAGDSHRKSTPHMQFGEQGGTTKAQAALSEIGGACDKRHILHGGGLDAKDGLSEVAQLRLTVLKLKQALDAKEETLLFLDDKMRYYEELTRHAEDAAATTTTTATIS